MFYYFYYIFFFKIYILIDIIMFTLISSFLTLTMSLRLMTSFFIDVKVSFISVTMVEMGELDVSTSIARARSCQQKLEWFCFWNVHILTFICLNNISTNNPLNKICWDKDRMKWMFFLQRYRFVTYIFQIVVIFLFNSHFDQFFFFFFYV